MSKTELLMNKPMYLGLSILELSKILMYEFWYDYVKPKYGKKSKFCSMNTGSFILYIKTDDIYKDIAEDVELECHSIERSLPKGKNKKIIGLMKYELCRKIVTVFIGLGAKT